MKKLLKIYIILVILGYSAYGIFSLVKSYHDNKVFKSYCEGVDDGTIWAFEEVIDIFDDRYKADRDSSRNDGHTRLGLETAKGDTVYYLLTRKDFVKK